MAPLVKSNKQNKKKSFFGTPYCKRLITNKSQLRKREERKVSVPVFQQSLLSQSGKGSLQKSKSVISVKSVSVITKEEV